MGTYRSRLRRSGNVVEDSLFSSESKKTTFLPGIGVSWKRPAGEWYANAVRIRAVNFSDIQINNLGVVVDPDVADNEVPMSTWAFGCLTKNGPLMPVHLFFGTRVESACWPHHSDRSGRKTSAVAPICPMPKPPVWNVLQVVGLFCPTVTSPPFWAQLLGCIAVMEKGNSRRLKATKLNSFLGP